MATTHTAHSLPPAPPPLPQQGSNGHAAPLPSPALPTNGTEHQPYITPVPNHGTHADTRDGSAPDSAEECPFTPLSPLFPEEVNWTMSVLYSGRGHDGATDDHLTPLGEEEGSIHGSVVSSDCEPVTYIDDVSSQSDGEEGERDGYVTQPAQPEDLHYRSGDVGWSSDTDNPALRFSFTLHDIPEAEEDRESEGEGDWPRRRAPPNQLTLPPNMSALSVASSEHSFGTRPPSLPLSPPPGELMSPTSMDVLNSSSPRYTALFDRFNPVESPIHAFDAILRELSRSISLDRIVSGDHPSSPTSTGSTAPSTKEGDFQSVVQQLRGEGRASVSPSHNDEDAEGPFSRQRKVSNESASSQMKVSRSLDYLSEVVSFMERFSLDVEEEEGHQQEVSQQGIIGEV